MNDTLNGRRKAMIKKLQPIFGVAIVALHFLLVFLLERCDLARGGLALIPLKVIEVPVTPKEELPLWDSEEPGKAYWAMHLTSSPERVVGPILGSSDLVLKRWNGWEVVAHLRGDGYAKADQQGIYRLTITEESPPEEKLPPRRREPLPVPTLPKLITPEYNPVVPEPSVFGLLGFGVLLTLLRRKR